MNGMMSPTDMAALKNASGPDSSKLLLQQMTQHHQGPIDMANKELASGNNTAALALAKKIVAAQTAEIATMKEMLASISTDSRVGRSSCGRSSRGLQVTGYGGRPAPPGYRLRNLKDLEAGACRNNDHALPHESMGPCASEICLTSTCHVTTGHRISVTTGSSGCAGASRTEMRVLLQPGSDVVDERVERVRLGALTHSTGPLRRGSDVPI